MVVSSLWREHKGRRTVRLKPQRERGQLSGQPGEHFTDTKVKAKIHCSNFFLPAVCVCERCCGDTSHIKVTNCYCGSLRCVLLFTAPLSGCVLIACGQPPTPCGFLPMHLPVPMATGNSIAIKQLQPHFQVVLVKGALCIAYDFITVFSSYVAQSHSTHTASGLSLKKWCLILS